MPINEFLTSLSQLFDLLMNNPAALSVALYAMAALVFLGLLFYLKAFCMPGAGRAKLFTALFC